MADQSRTRIVDAAEAIPPSPYSRQPLAKGTSGTPVYGVTFNTAKEKKILGLGYRNKIEDMSEDFEQRGW